MTALLELYGALDHATLVDWVAKEYGIATNDGDKTNNKHRVRRAEMAERVRLYRDDGAEDIALLIDLIWTRADLRDKLKAYIGFDPNLGKASAGAIALMQNVSTRIVHEVASLYDKPAVRTLGTSRQDAFKLEEKRLRLHEITQDYHRLLWLCNEVLIWQFKGVDGKTKLKVVTPDVFDVVPDPRDVTAMAGALIAVPCTTMLPPDQRAKLPIFELWDDTYRYLINSHGKMVDEKGEEVQTPEEHKLSRIPGVLLHRREPSDRALDPRPGRDIASAHRAVSLLKIMLLRLCKTQGERQPILKGNLASFAKGQTADGENPLALPPEVDVEMLDTLTQPDHLIKVTQDVLRSVGQTYGLSYEQLTYVETSSDGSGKAYQVRREKLSELRTEQRRRALVNEAEVIDLMNFPVDKLRVDHREQALPQDPTEAMALLDLQMRLGLDSPVKAKMREDPDLSRADAEAEIDQNLQDWAKLVLRARALNIPLNATVANPGNDPQINGSNKIVEKISVSALDGVQQPAQAAAPPQQTQRAAPAKNGQRR